MTDHKAEAEILLADAARQLTGSEVESSRQMQALVHATLFAGDQQRIANLIALAAHEPGNREALWRGVISKPTGPDGLELTAEIRAGLGLS